MKSRIDNELTKRTCVVAEVGKTRMWVQVTSWGVESWQLTEAALNLSSGVNWSAISLSVLSGSRDTRHALSTQGAADGYSRLHWPQISFKCFDAFRRALRDNSQLQPFSSPWPIRPTRPTTSLHGCTWECIILISSHISTRLKFSILNWLNIKIHLILLIHIPEIYLNLFAHNQVYL